MAGRTLSTTTERGTKVLRIGHLLQLEVRCFKVPEGNLENNWAKNELQQVMLAHKSVIYLVAFLLEGHV